MCLREAFQIERQHIVFFTGFFKASKLLRQFLENEQILRMTSGKDLLLLRFFYAIQVWKGCCLIVFSKGAETPVHGWARLGVAHEQCKGVLGRQLRCVLEDGRAARFWHSAAQKCSSVFNCGNGFGVIQYRPALGLCTRRPQFGIDSGAGGMVCLFAKSTGPPSAIPSRSLRGRRLTGHRIG